MPIEMMRRSMVMIMIMMAAPAAMTSNKNIISSNRPISRTRCVRQLLQGNSFCYVFEFVHFRSRFRNVICFFWQRLAQSNL